jgi:peptide/nickel transport system substrate-binding protein
MLSEILNSMATNNMVCNLLFSKFVKYDDHFQLVPDLITAVPTVENGGISADHRTYTYHLRANARWHDGVPVTSKDAKFTYEIIMDPKVQVESREGWDVVESVATPDDTTIVFHLKRPYPDFVSEDVLR